MRCQLLRASHDSASALSLSNLVWRTADTCAKTAVRSTDLRTLEDDVPVGHRFEFGLHSLLCFDERLEFVVRQSGQRLNCSKRQLLHILDTRARELGGSCRNVSHFKPPRKRLVAI